MRTNELDAWAQSVHDGRAERCATLHGGQGLHLKKSSLDLRDDSVAGIKCSSLHGVTRPHRSTCHQVTRNCGQWAWNRAS